MALFCKAILFYCGLSLLAGGGDGYPQPTPPSRAEVFRVQLEQSFFRTFDEFAQFLRSYFSSPFREATEDDEDSPEDGETLEDLTEGASPHVLRKRSVHLPPAFEDVERKYLIKQSTELLKQFAGYVEYVDKSDDTRSYLEDMLKQQGDALIHMTRDQLRNYLGTLQRTMETGVNSQHQMVINGKVYSLDHISSWCCNFG